MSDQADAISAQQLAIAESDATSHSWLRENC
jgi:hypothetical protein